MHRCGSVPRVSLEGLFIIIDGFRQEFDLFRDRAASGVENGAAIITLFGLKPLSCRDQAFPRPAAEPVGFGITAPGLGILILEELIDAQFRRAQYSKLSATFSGIRRPTGSF